MIKKIIAFIALISIFIFAYMQEKNKESKLLAQNNEVKDVFLGTQELMKNKPFILKFKGQLGSRSFRMIVYNDETTETWISPRGEKSTPQLRAKYAGEELKVLKPEDTFVTIIFSEDSKVKFFLTKNK